MEEKKIFKTVEEVADYLQNKCLDTDCEKKLENIEVDGMQKYLPNGKYIIRYDIHLGTDEVVAIFLAEDRKEYIWREMDDWDFREIKYEARTVDNEEIGNAIADYPQYVRDCGCLDVSRWLLEEYCDSRLSVDYDVMTKIGHIQ